MKVRPDEQFHNRLVKNRSKERLYSGMSTEKDMQQFDYNSFWSVIHVIFHFHPQDSPRNETLSWEGMSLSLYTISLVPQSNWNRSSPHAVRCQCQLASTLADYSSFSGPTWIWEAIAPFSYQAHRNAALTSFTMFGPSHTNWNQSKWRFQKVNLPEFILWFFILLFILNSVLQ